MGLETAAAIGMGASGLYGALSQNRSNARNQRAAQQQQAQLQQMITPYLTAPGAQNPYASAIMQFLGGGGAGQPRTPNPLGGGMNPGSIVPSDIGAGGGGSQTGLQSNPFTYNPVSATGPAPVGTESFNAGQDALLQMMRSSPEFQRSNTLDATLQQLMGGQGFNVDQLLGAQSDVATRGLNEQIAQQRAGAGSLGQRFGTASQGAEAKLRGDFLTNLAAQRAQTSLGAYQANQGNILQAAGLAGQQNQSLNDFLLAASGQRQSAATAAGQLGLQGRQIGSQEQQFNAGQALQLALANAGAQNQAGQFNAGQGQQAQQFLQSLMLQGLSTAGGLAQGSNNQNAQLLALLAGQQVPQQQPSALPGAFGDISQLALLWPFLQQAGGRAGARPSAMPMAPGIGAAGGGGGFPYIPFNYGG